jgi:hypothetical protein
VFIPATQRPTLNAQRPLQTLHDLAAQLHHLGVGERAVSRPSPFALPDAFGSHTLPASPSPAIRRNAFWKSWIYTNDAKPCGEGEDWDGWHHNRTDD